MVRFIAVAENTVKPLWPGNLPYRSEALSGITCPLLVVRFPPVTETCPPQDFQIAYKIQGYMAQWPDCISESRRSGLNSRALTLSGPKLYPAGEIRTCR